MTISVSQLNNYIHGVFDIDGVLNYVSVCGEITNAKKYNSGWFYTLKDEAAAIDCFCYDSAIQPENGMLVVAEGKINYWTKSGRVSFFVKRLTSSKNTGAAYLQFLQLKEKLQKEGLFDEERKKSIPQFCANIGVVTSATGAVIHDIENVVRRRQPFANILLCSVKVQGVGADIEIADGIKRLSKENVDVIIVGRGGGSNEDLSAFDSELVVRAVAECEKPIISAVGHGVDYTLCDYAADRRAVTPSEAAEFATQDCAKVRQAIISQLEYVSNLLSKRLSQQKDSVIHSSKSIGGVLERRVLQSKNVISRLLEKQRNTISASVVQKKAETQNLLVRLSAANPANILKKGYSALTKDGKRVTSVSQVKKGEVVCAKLFDGEFLARVEQVKK